MTKVKESVEDNYTDNFFKNLCIEKHEDEIRSQKFNSMTKRVAAQSDTKSATQNQSEHNHDSIQTTFRLKFAREPHIYSKFNIKNTNECKEGNYIN